MLFVVKKDVTTSRGFRQVSHLLLIMIQLEGDIRIFLNFMQFIERSD